MLSTPALDSLCSGVAMASGEEDEEEEGFSIDLHCSCAQVLGEEGIFIGLHCSCLLRMSSRARRVALRVALRVVRSSSYLLLVLH